VRERSWQHFQAPSDAGLYFFKLPTSFVRHPYWDVLEYRAALADLATLAAIRPHERPFKGGHVVQLDVGDFAASYRYLADRWHWSKDQAARFMLRLTRDGLLTKKRDGKRDSYPSVFHIEMPDVRDSHRDAHRDSQRDARETLARQSSTRKGKTGERTTETTHAAVDQGNGPDRGIDRVTDQVKPWGSPQELVAFYNEQAPEKWSRCTKLTTARAKKFAEYLKAFPEREFWEAVIVVEPLRSPFLLGKAQTPGRKPFTGSLDWLVQCGSNDGVENCVKVFEGKYRGEPSNGVAPAGPRPRVPPLGPVYDPNR
jgi:hypothetical protein